MLAFSMPERCCLSRRGKQYREKSRSFLGSILGSFLGSILGFFLGSILGFFLGFFLGSILGFFPGSFLAAFPADVPESFPRCIPRRFAVVLPSRAMRAERSVGVGRWNVFVGKQRSYSIAGTGQIVGTAKR